MPAVKYLSRVSGRLQEVIGTVTGGTATQGGAIVALDDTGRLDPSLLPTGVGQDVVSVTAGAALTAGDFVAITSAGAVRASAAAGGSQAQAIGFVVSSFASGATATVYYDGINPGVTGLTVGSRYYLSDITPGGLTATPVSGTGKLHQYLGTANTTTSLAFKADDGIILA